MKTKSVPKSAKKQHEDLSEHDQSNLHKPKQAKEASLLKKQSFKTDSQAKHQAKQIKKLEQALDNAAQPEADKLLSDKDITNAAETEATGSDSASIEQEVKKEIEEEELNNKHATKKLAEENERESSEQRQIQSKEDESAETDDQSK